MHGHLENPGFGVPGEAKRLPEPKSAQKGTAGNPLPGTLKNQENPGVFLEN